MKGNSKIKEKFFKKILTQKIRKTCFLAPKLGVDLYTGSTYTQVNTVHVCEYGKCHSVELSEVLRSSLVG